MTWLIEIDINEDVEGPRHGELLDVISTALEEHARGYATRVTVGWRNPAETPYKAVLKALTDEVERLRLAVDGMGPDLRRHLCEPHVAVRKPR